MFKKNRNALLEEMRKIAVSEARVQAAKAVSVQLARENARKREVRERDHQDYLMQTKIEAAVADAMAGHSDGSVLAMGQTLESGVHLQEQLLDGFQLLLDLVRKNGQILTAGKAEVGLLDLDQQRVSCFLDFVHSVSPLRSGLCAVTQSSPTMTVAENGCTCAGAASGAGVSSAAPASQTSEGGAA